MKTKYLTWGSLAVITLVFSGCGNDKSGNDTHVLSERSVLTGETPHLTEKDVMILSLEHPQNSSVSNDTGEAGVDCFTIKATQDMRDVIIDIDDALSVSHAIIKHKNSGKTTMVQNIDDANTSYTFKAGEQYEYCVHHNGIEENDEVFFVRFETSKQSGINIRAADADVQKLKNSKDCVSCDFSNYNFISNSITSLAGMNLSEANLAHASMMELNLDDANFTDANLTGVRLIGNSMVGTIMDDAAIDTTFRTMFRPTTIDHASFKNLDLHGVNFTTINTMNAKNYNTFDSVNFTGADLNSVNFSEKTFNNCIFDYANLFAADFTSVTLKGVSSFNGANMRNAILIDADFSNAQMIWTYTEGAEMETTILYDVNTTGLIWGRYHNIVYWPNGGLRYEDTEHVTAEKLNYDDAVNYCENLELSGYTNWRLPSAIELGYIGTEGLSSPSIADGFEHCEADMYWTSTWKDDESVSVLDFSDGVFERGQGKLDPSVSVDEQDYPVYNYVRCVHDPK